MGERKGGKRRTREAEQREWERKEGNHEVKAYIYVNESVIKLTYAHVKFQNVPGDDPGFRV